MHLWHELFDNGCWYHTYCSLCAISVHSFPEDVIVHKAVFSFFGLNLASLYWGCLLALGLSNHHTRDHLLRHIFPHIGQVSRGDLSPTRNHSFHHKSIVCKSNSYSNHHFPSMPIPCFRTRFQRWYDNYRQNADDSDPNEIAGVTELQPRNTLERRRSKNPIKDTFHWSIDSL